MFVLFLFSLSLSSFLPLFLLRLCYHRRRHYHHHYRRRFLILTAEDDMEIKLMFIDVRVVNRHLFGSISSLSSSCLGVTADIRPVLTLRG